MNKKTIKLVIGSYGSYNVCNEKAFGSKWLDLADFDTWEDVEKELKEEGFKLYGIDEELFIQDIEGLKIDTSFIRPKRLFKIIKMSQVLNDTMKFETMEAIIEAYGFDYFFESIEKNGEDWDNQFIFYYDMTLEDLAYELVEEQYSYKETDDFLLRYFDYERLARDLSFDYTETLNGVICCL